MTSVKSNQQDGDVVGPMFSAGPSLHDALGPVNDHFIRPWIVNTFAQAVLIWASLDLSPITRLMFSNDEWVVIAKMVYRFKWGCYK